MEKKTLKIKHLQWLLAYSSNFNPIERLWKVMNERARNKLYFAKPKEFRDSIQHFFEVTLPKIGASLTGRINDNFQQIKNATGGCLDTYHESIRNNIGYIPNGNAPTNSR